MQYAGLRNCSGKQGRAAGHAPLYKADATLPAAMQHRSGNTAFTINSGTHRAQQDHAEQAHVGWRLAQHQVVPVPGLQAEQVQEQVGALLQRQDEEGSKTDGQC